MSAQKFAKKGHLVVDLDSKSPKMAVVGGKTGKISEKKILEKAGIKEEPAAKGKKEKPAKAEKAKAAKKESAPREADTRKIKLLTKENPKREGSSAHDRFELYRGAKTVADFLEAGGTMGDVRYDEQKGYISLS